MPIITLTVDELDLCNIIIGALSDQRKRVVDSAERINSIYARTKLDAIIAANLRQIFPQLLSAYSNERLAKEYHDFELSDMFGGNDERFLEWLSLVPQSNPDGE